MQIKIDPTKLVLLPVDQLKPHPKNRNKHSEYQIDRLCSLIKYQGFRQPIIVSNQSGFIVVGHGRLEAAKKLTMSHVPVIFQDFDSEEQEYAFCVSDNAIAAWSELDLSGINSDIPDLGPAFDIEMLGIKNFSLDAGELDDSIEQLNDEREKKWILEAQFPNEMEMRDVHDDLMSRGYMVKVRE